MKLMMFSLHINRILRSFSAKIEELTKWKSLGVCTEVDDIGQNRITGRWVYTWKMINGKLIPKAR